MKRASAAQPPGRLGPKKPKKQWSLFFLALPLMALVVLLKYVPIAGWAIAFVDYRPGIPVLQNRFVGLAYFLEILTDRDILNALKNTLVFSGISYLISPLPMLFAILLNELSNTRFRKFAQTATTLPHFFSWVICYALIFSVFSTDGVLNTVLKATGISDRPNTVLTNPSLVYAFQTAVGQWKGLGWSAIIYVAAIAGIDQELYEAARIDGAGRLRCALHITVPGILPTFIVLLLLSISNIINTGYEQYFVFKNALVYEKIEVLDLYIYRMGLQLGDYSYATAVGILKSFISIAMLFVANALAKRIRGTAII